VQPSNTASEFLKSKTVLRVPIEDLPQQLFLVFVGRELRSAIPDFYRGLRA
jgi:hypothetical protein